MTNTKPSTKTTKQAAKELDQTLVKQAADIGQFLLLAGRQYP
jgi:hypothetical protein